MKEYITPPCSSPLSSWTFCRATSSSGTLFFTWVVRMERKNLDDWVWTGFIPLLIHLLLNTCRAWSLQSWMNEVRVKFQGFRVRVHTAALSERVAPSYIRLTLNTGGRNGATADLKVLYHAQCSFWCLLHISLFLRTHILCLKMCCINKLTLFSRLPEICSHSNQLIKDAGNI